MPVAERSAALDGCPAQTAYGRVTAIDPKDTKWVAAIGDGRATILLKDLNLPALGAVPVRRW
jgi:hypothetical protein